MRLNWKGRSYRPAANYIRVYKPDINELMKPLSQKGKLGSAILTGEFISGIGDNYGPEPTSPVVTPSVTPTQTNTPEPTPSVTPSITPSITPSSSPLPADCLWNTTDEFWSGNTNNWEVCQDVPQPSPSVTLTMTPSPTASLTPSVTATYTPTVTSTVTLEVTPSSTPTNTPTPTPKCTLTRFTANTVTTLTYTRCDGVFISMPRQPGDVNQFCRRNGTVVTGSGSRVDLGAC